METPVLFFQGEEHSSLSDLSEPSSAFIKKNIRNPSKQAPAKPKKTLLRALTSTPGGIIAHRPSRTHSRAALADVVADVVVAAADLAVNGGFVLGTTDSLEVCGLGLLAGHGVDVAALGQRDLAVVAGALAADLDFGAGELGFDVFVYAGFLGWKGGEEG